MTREEALDYYKKQTGSGGTLEETLAFYEQARKKQEQFNSDMQAEQQKTAAKTQTKKSSKRPPAAAEDAVIDPEIPAGYTAAYKDRSRPEHPENVFNKALADSSYENRLQTIKDWNDSFGSTYLEAGSQAALAREIKNGEVPSWGIVKPVNEIKTSAVGANPATQNPQQKQTVASIEPIKVPATALQTNTSAGHSSVFFIFLWTALIVGIGFLFCRWLSLRVEPKWQKVDLNEATKHKLFGVRGWLILFGTSWVLSVASTLGKTNQRLAEYKTGLSWWQILFSDYPDANIFTFTIICMVLISGMIITLMVKRHKDFRIISIVSLLLQAPFFIGLTYISVHNLYLQPIEIQTIIDEVTHGSVSWIIACAVWIPYLQLSRRVRVTFEQSILASSPVPSEQSLETPAIVALPTKKTTNYASSSSEPTAAQPISSRLTLDNYDHFWSLALTEFDSSARKAGLWARLFSEAQGNENLAKANYLQARVDEMKLEKP
jgi:Protein of unknown function (DUF2569)